MEEIISRDKGGFHLVAKIIKELNPKGCGGGQNDPLVTDKACMPSIFIKTPQIFF